MRTSVKLDLSDAWSYQPEGIRWLASRKSALLADEPGLGKTFMTLRALPRRARTVIVCPMSAIDVWVKEAAKWRPDLYVTTDEPLRRPHEREILIVSWGSLPELSETSSLLVPEPMGDVHLVGDEIQMCKSDDALRSLKWRRLAHQCGVVWGLTGTPMTGTPEDFWGVLVSCRMTGAFGDTELDMGAREHFVHLCGGEPRYIRRKIRGPTGRVRYATKRAGFTWGRISPEVLERCKRGGMLRRFRADVLPDLPQRQWIDVPVRAPADLRELLDETERDAWADVEPDELPPFERISQARALLAESRIDAACDFADAHSSYEQPLLVFSAHKEPVRAVGELRGAAYFDGDTPKDERDRLVAEFQAGKLRILAMTIQTGGVSLNLTAAAGQLFVDLDWTPGNNEQAELRSARPGQKRPRIPIWRMVTEHPLDLRLYEILTEKQRMIAEATGKPTTTGQRKQARATRPKPDRLPAQPKRATSARAASKQPARRGSSPGSRAGPPAASRR